MRLCKLRVSTSNLVVEGAERSAQPPVLQVVGAPAPEAHSHADSSVQSFMSFRLIGPHHMMAARAWQLGTWRFSMHECTSVVLTRLSSHETGALIHYNVTNAARQSPHVALEDRSIYSMCNTMGMPCPYICVD